MSEKNHITVEEIARACHEANRSYCEIMGDDSQVAWDVAPEWQRLSAIDGVKHRLDNPTSSAADSHANWLKLKESEGWTWGPHKDAEKKEHPCIVPYEELPLYQQVKDSVFTAIIDALCPLLETPSS